MYPTEALIATGFVSFLVGFFSHLIFSKQEISLDRSYFSSDENGDGSGPTLEITYTAGGAVIGNNPIFFGGGM